MASFYGKEQLEYTNFEVNDGRYIFLSIITIEQWFPILNWVCQIKETYKMCRAVGPQDLD